MNHLQTRYSIISLVRTEATHDTIFMNLYSIYHFMISFCIALSTTINNTFLIGIQKLE